MSLKVHLFIVTLIILSVFMAWRWMQSHDLTAAHDNAPMHTVEIVRASWGLNCGEASAARPGDAVPAGPFSRENAPPALRENNILQVISALCNGKPECAIRNSPDALGGDFAPECTDKEITVEYRCFSYDRPWLLRIVPRATGVIHCQDAAAAP